LVSIHQSSDKTSRRLTADDILTVAEAAELLKMPRSTVADHARRGVIPSRKLGRRRIILRPELERLLLDTSGTN
jgi:excisionase family DNA binding protein